MKKREYKKALKEILHRKIVFKVFDNVLKHVMAILCGEKCACADAIGLMGDLKYINRLLVNKKVKKLFKKDIKKWFYEKSVKGLLIDDYIEFHKFECKNRDKINSKLLKYIFHDLAKLVIKSGKYIKASDLEKLLDKYITKNDL
jgi:hypothetical protein